MGEGGSARWCGVAAQTYGMSLRGGQGADEGAGGNKGKTSGVFMRCERCQRSQKVFSMYLRRTEPVESAIPASRIMHRGAGVCSLDWPDKMMRAGAAVETWDVLVRSRTVAGRCRQCTSGRVLLPIWARLMNGGCPTARGA